MMGKACWRNHEDILPRVKKQKLGLERETERELKGTFKLTLPKSNP